MAPHSPAFALLADFGHPDGDRGSPDLAMQLKAEFESGYQQGLSDGRAEAQADGELKLAEAERLFAEQLANERETWQRECADVLIARFDGAIKLIERNIEARVAALLRPWLIEQLRQRALLDLEKAIARALAEGARVHIEAPAEVLSHLRERLPTGAFHIGYSESTSPDIRAHVDDTEIEANISAWVAELEATES